MKKYNLIPSISQNGYDLFGLVSGNDLKYLEIDVDDASQPMSKQERFHQQPIYYNISPFSFVHVHTRAFFDTYCYYACTNSTSDYPSLHMRFLFLLIIYTSFNQYNIEDYNCTYTNLVEQYHLLVHWENVDY